MKTFTVKELKQYLNYLPDDYKLFLSSDEEGNSFSTIDRELLVSKADKTAIFYPLHEGMELEDIMPKEYGEDNE